MGLACNLAASFLSAATYGEGGQVSGAARRRLYHTLASGGDTRGSIFHRLSSICSSYRRTAQGEQGCSHTHCIVCPSSSRRRYEQEKCSPKLPGVQQDGERQEGGGYLSYRKHQSPCLSPVRWNMNWTAFTTEMFMPATLARIWEVASRRSCWRRRVRACMCRDT